MSVTPADLPRSIDDVVNRNDFMDRVVALYEKGVGDIELEADVATDIYCLDPCGVSGCFGRRDRLIRKSPTNASTFSLMYVSGVGPTSLKCSNLVRMMVAATCFSHGSKNLGLIAATGCNAVAADDPHLFVRVTLLVPLGACAHGVSRCIFKK